MAAILSGHRIPKHQMTPDKIKELIKCGETSTVQFKRLFKTAEDIANELVAFSNSKGGNILIGIDDKTGDIEGLDFAQVRHIGSLIANAANDRIHPIVYPEIDTILVDDKAIMIVSVPKGTDAPYTNNKGEIYVKQGCDKRRVTDNNEILRLFANSGTFQPDRQSIRGSSINDIDSFAIADFFERTLQKTPDNLGIPLEKALQNLFILDEEGQLTLGGLMFFGKQPQRLCPAFDIKAVWFFGNSIGGTEYHDSKNITGTIPEMFEQGMRFIESCLHRRQEGQNFNSVGILEISEVALVEILQNALVHRSWLKPAPIRILIFDNRVEIISPGALPPNLTIDDIKLGNAYQRNQLIATLCAKTMDYRGLGSGIIRALKSDPNIEFHNEISGDQFRVILRRDTSENNGSFNNPEFYSEISYFVNEAEASYSTSSERRKEKSYPENQDSSKSKDKKYPKQPYFVKSKEKSKENSYSESQDSSKNKEKSYSENHHSPKSKEKKYPKQPYFVKSKEKSCSESQDIPKSKEKSKEKILYLIKGNPNITSDQLQRLVNLSRSGVEKIVRQLKNDGKIRRIGPDRGGHWEVIE